MTEPTALDAYDRLAAVLDCLGTWDQTMDDLQPAATLVDLDAIARAVCVLDATARTALRRLEHCMLAGQPDPLGAASVFRPLGGQR